MKPQTQALSGLPINRFHIWLQWLRELGGTYEPMRDLTEPKPRTGRRDLDRKPRQYLLSDEKYGEDKNGSIWRRPNA